MSNPSLLCGLRVVFRRTQILPSAGNLRGGRLPPPPPLPTFFREKVRRLFFFLGQKTGVEHFINHGHHDHRSYWTFGRCSRPFTIAKSGRVYFRSFCNSWFNTLSSNTKPETTLDPKPGFSQVANKCLVLGLGRLGMILALAMNVPMVHWVDS